MTGEKQRRLALLLCGTAALLALLTGWYLLRPRPASVMELAPAVSGTLPEEALLDLNTAAEEELECLPGVGPVLAEAILTRRAELGAFRTAEDVLSVPGIGAATYEKIAPYITY